MTIWFKPHPSMTHWISEIFMNKKKASVIVLFTFCVFLALFSCASKEKETFSEEQWIKQVEKTKTKDLYAPHFKEGKYYAPWMQMGDKSFFDVLGWKLFGRMDFTKQEKGFLPQVLPDTADRLSLTKGDFILWIGHNTFLIHVNGDYWLTDPMFSDRALLPKRLTPPAISLKDLSRITGSQLNIVISHNHYDHLDRSSMEGLPESSRVFVPMGLKNYVQKMKKENTHEMDWWESFDLGRGSTLICLPAQHWSMRISQGRNKSLWASWLLITPDTTFYLGGDSGYFKGFKAIGKKYPKIDYAFMATTAYHPRWFMHFQHMNVPEAVQGFKDLGALYFIPTQWGTFHLGSEPAGFPGLDLKRYIQTGDVDTNRFKIMDIGQILPIEKHIQ